MNLTLKLLSLVIASAICAATAKDTCPAKEILHPCICEQDYLLTSIRCSNISSMETLVDVFERSGDMRFKFFALDHSSLMYLPAASLQSKRFKGLLLGNVTLTSLFDKVPSVSNELEMLSLNNASMQRGVRWDLLENLSKLTFLQVVKTEIKTLGRSFVKYVGNKKIANMFFMDTKTTQLDDNVFATFTSLKELHVTKNKIKSLKRSMFPRPSPIKIFVFPENELETLPEDIFSDWPSLEFVMLRNNRISKFPEPTYGGIFDKLTILNIESNPINCDCSMEWLLSRKDYSKAVGTCGKPQDKQGRRLSDITKEDLAYCHQSPEANMLETIFDE